MCIECAGSETCKHCDQGWCPLGHPPVCNDRFDENGFPIVPGPPPSPSPSIKQEESPTPDPPSYRPSREPPSPTPAQTLSTGPLKTSEVSPPENPPSPPVPPSAESDGAELSDAELFGAESPDTESPDNESSDAASSNAGGSDSESPAVESPPRAEQPHQVQTRPRPAPRSPPPPSPTSPSLEQLELPEGWTVDNVIHGPVGTAVKARDCNNDPVELYKNPWYSLSVRRDPPQPPQSPRGSQPARPTQSPRHQANAAHQSQRIAQGSEAQGGRSFQAEEQLDPKLPCERFDQTLPGHVSRPPTALTRQDDILEPNYVPRVAAQPRSSVAPQSHLQPRPSQEAQRLVQTRLPFEAQQPSSNRRSEPADRLNAGYGSRPGSSNARQDHVARPGCTPQAVSRPHAATPLQPPYQAHPTQAAQTGPRHHLPSATQQPQSNALLKRADGSYVGHGYRPVTGTAQQTNVSRRTTVPQTLSRALGPGNLQSHPQYRPNQQASQHLHQTRLPFEARSVGVPQPGRSPRPSVPAQPPRGVPFPGGQGRPSYGSRSASVSRPPARPQSNLLRPNVGPYSVHGQYRAATPRSSTHTRAGYTPQVNTMPHSISQLQPRLNGPHASISQEPLSLSTPTSRPAPISQPTSRLRVSPIIPRGVLDRHSTSILPTPSLRPPPLSSPVSCTQPGSNQRQAPFPRPPARLRLVTAPDSAFRSRPGSYSSTASNMEHSTRVSDAASRTPTIPWSEGSPRSANTARQPILRLRPDSRQSEQTLQSTMAPQQPILRLRPDSHHQSASVLESGSVRREPAPARVPTMHEPTTRSGPPGELSSAPHPYVIPTLQVTPPDDPPETPSQPTSKSSADKLSLPKPKKIKKTSPLQGKPRGKGWSEEEEQAMGEEMHKLCTSPTTIRLGVDAKFREVSHRLNNRGIDRSDSACKNYWSRGGRAKFGIDERKKPNSERLVTSQLAYRRDGPPVKPGKKRKSEDDRDHASQPKQRKSTHNGSAGQSRKRKNMDNEGFSGYMAKKRKRDDSEEPEAEFTDDEEEEDDVLSDVDTTPHQPRQQPRRASDATARRPAPFIAGNNYVSTDSEIERQSDIGERIRMKNEKRQRKLRQSLENNTAYRTPSKRRRFDHDDNDDVNSDYVPLDS